MEELNKAVLVVIGFLLTGTLLFIRLYSPFISIWLFAVLSFASGLALSTFLLSNFKEIPNLILLLQLSGTLKTKALKLDSTKELKKPGCTVCSKKGCSRHKKEPDSLEVHPWENLTLPQPVDIALSEFLEIVLRTHLYSWYWDISRDQGFVDEARHILRYSMAVILRRAKKIQIPKFLLSKIVKKFMIHLDCFSRSKERAPIGSDIQQLVLERMRTYKHFCVQNEVAEAEYLRYLIQSLLPHLLPHSALDCRAATYFVEELMSGTILKPLIEKLAEPDIVNNLLLMLLDESTIPEPDYEPFERVQFLEDFSKKRSPHDKSALTVSAYELMHDNTYLYPFMQFMKREGSLNLLQFCLAVEEFNKRSLAPELTEDEKNTILEEAEEIDALYFRKNALDKIDFPLEIVQDFQEAVSSPNDTMMRLRTAAPLFRAYEHVVDLLEKTHVPLFHHSDEFYALLCGDRSPKKKKAVESAASKRKFMPILEFSKLASKIKAKKQRDRGFTGFFDDVDTPPEEGFEAYDNECYDDDGDMDDTDDDSDESFDLSYWHITIPNIDFVLEKNKKTYVFILNVERIGGRSTAQDETQTQWQVVRKYNEFYVLDTKLRRFHDLLNNAELPAKRTILKKDYEYLNSIRLRLQEYLQRLVRSPVLRGSSLLHSFLTPGAEITGMFEPESVGREAGRKVKSLKNKLVIEKGQNLEPFLNSFILSAEPPLKKKITTKPAPVYGSSGHRRRDSRMYLPPPAWAQNTRQRNLSDSSDDVFVSQGNSVTHYILYAARNIFKVSPWLHHILTGVQYLFKNSIDAMSERYIEYKLSLATADLQLVDYIHLIRDLIFFDDEPPRTDSDKVERRDATLSKMLTFAPERVVNAIGVEKHDVAIRTLFEMFQCPKLNKQLVYILLDELLVELFPELTSNSPSKT